MGRTTPTSGITVRQLVERYVRAPSPGWPPAKQTPSGSAKNHIYPHLVAAEDAAKT